MIWAETVPAGNRLGKGLMAGHDNKGLVIDRQLVLGHSHHHGLADQPPGHGIEILTTDDKPFGIDIPVENLRGVVRLCRQRQKARLFFRMPIQRTCLGLPMNVYISNLGQPPFGRVVQVLQRKESPATQQAGFDIVEMSFYLPLGLWPARTAGNRSKTIMGCKP